MSKLAWDQAGEKLFETGASKAVVFPSVGGVYPTGVAWNGFTGFTESPSGAEAKALWANNVKYLSLTSAEEFGGTITAFMYPDVFGELNGEKQVAQGVRIGQQKRGIFGLTYQTIIGNDTDGNDHGYKIHLVYGAQAAPSEKAYKTANDAPEANDMSWPITTTPVTVAGFKPTATLVVDSTTTDPVKLAALEDILYGTDSIDARMPLPDEVVELIGGAVPSALALSSTTPVDAATAVAVGASVVLTFNNKIAKESIIVTSDAGVVIACTKTVDAAGKVLTFKPASNLSAATKYLVAVVGVSDIYNQTLAPVVKKFTTA